MRKILLAATILTTVISGEAAAATKYISSSTITYNGITYKYSSTSTCPDGTAALRMYRKWWCPPISTSTSSGTNTGGTTTTPTTTTPTSYSANISWAVPSVRADGSPLSVSELSGYEIYYTNDNGSISVSVPVAGGSTVNTVVGNLASGNYYFSIAAIDINGLKSVLSTVVPLSFP